VTAALEDTEFCRGRAGARIRTRIAAARCAPDSCRESAANYVLVQVGDTAPFIDALGARKIHVRDRSKDPATPGCIRITAGMLEHTDRAIEALESVVAGGQTR
jgi:histidinol-phosphate/aromatic aminotransferase/cobyric acid decarboxylase-like protein